jgi:hypothetical protein
MPLPNPSKYKSEDSYISACMSAQEGEDKPQKQKLAICYSKWENKDKKESVMKEKKVDAKKVIKDLAKSYGDSNENQGKMAQLIRGLAFSDDEAANKFMQALDKWTTEYVNKNMKKEEIMREKSTINERRFDLGSGHLGDGITVWNRAKEVHGDYEKIAHIGADRDITWYIDNPPREVIDYVNDIVRGENPSISTTQTQKVFRNESVIEVKEEIQIGDIVLEEGDKIKVIESKKVMSVKDYVEYLKSAPDAVVNDMLTMFANKRKQWNNREINITKSEQEELKNFQQAVSKLGIAKSKDEFMKWAME